MTKEVVVGNAIEEGQDQRGWFIGAFVDTNGLQQTKDLEVKWSNLKKGDSWVTKASDGNATTLGMLVYGKFQVEFEDEMIVLEKEGDYMMFQPNQWHRNTVLEDTLYITVRWPSLSAEKN